MAKEEEPETKPPEKAKVLLLSRIWECSKCGEVLATNWRGDAFHLEGPPWSEITIEGNVKIRLDDAPLVMCPGCGTANLWPDELRERIGGKAPEPALPYDVRKLSTPTHDHTHHHPEGDGSTALYHSHPEPHHEEEVRE